jgi:hypothetical protein
MDPDYNFIFANFYVTIMINYTNKLGVTLLLFLFLTLNVKDRLNLATYRLNILSGDKVS